MEKDAPKNAANEIPTLSSSLLNQVRDMNPDGWTRLVEVFGPIVYRWCRQSGVPAHDAADVVQEIFASVARGISRFERKKSSGGSFRSWLATISRSRICDYFRRLKRRPIARGGSDAKAHWEDLAAAMESSVNNEKTDVRIARRVLELVEPEFEPRTWQAFWLTTIDRRVAADVAEELEMSLASVYQAKSRVLRRLRQRIGELPG